ncbi:MAG: hypothetical protein ACXABY_34485 [Candidatus Thorarchaeota archaeon]|jgi:hypothetical protein
MPKIIEIPLEAKEAPMPGEKVELKIPVYVRSIRVDPLLPSQESVSAIVELLEPATVIGVQSGMAMTSQYDPRDRFVPQH